MTIRTVRPEDSRAWERMREALWPSAPGEHAAEIDGFFASDRRDPAEVFLAFDDSGRAIGFADVSIRSHAEGCEPGRIAYLEGWYVEPRSRRQGVGAAMVAAAEGWALERGCSEFASDAEWDNQASAAAHRALGFEDIGM